MLLFSLFLFIKMDQKSIPESSFLVFLDCNFVFLSSCRSLRIFFELNIKKISEKLLVFLLINW